jgi:hypothetical protein
MIIPTGAHLVRRYMQLDAPSATRPPAQNWMEPAPFPNVQHSL